MDAILILPPTSEPTKYDMEYIWDFLRDLQSRDVAYPAVALIIIIWWITRSFVRLYKQATGGLTRIERSIDAERPRRRLPLQ